MRPRKISKEHLIRDYLSLKMKLSRRPVCAEFARHHHSIATLGAVFNGRGWSRLLKAAGEDSASLTREHLLNDYFELKRELGRRPTCLDFAKKHHSITSLRTVFGGPGWTSLLKAAGEDLRDPALFTRDALIRDYRSLKEKLGRQPTCDEFVKECRCQWFIDRIFEKPGWRKLVRAAGDKPLTEQNLPADHLVRDFLDLQARLGRRPLAVEYRDQCHSYKVLHRVFGKPGWRNLVKAIGKKALPQPTRRERLAGVSHSVDSR